MPKIDERIEILPDIEMYGGNSDTWVVQLFDPSHKRYTYDELESKNCSFTLIIKDSGFARKDNGAAVFSLTKSGTLELDTDGVSASAVFGLESSDTLAVNGKFTYQIEMVCNGVNQAAQGTLIIRRNINQ